MRSRQKRAIFPEVLAYPVADRHTKERCSSSKIGLVPIPTGRLCEIGQWNAKRMTVGKKCYAEHNGGRRIDVEPPPYPVPLLPFLPPTHSKRCAAVFS